MFYNLKVVKKKSNEVVEEYEKITKELFHLQELIKNSSISEMTENILLYDCTYWALSIFNKHQRSMSEFIADSYLDYLKNSKNINLIFEVTGSHYHKPIKERYSFVSNFFSKHYFLDFSSYIKNPQKYNEILEELNKKQVYDVKYLKLNKPEPTSMTIEDICDDICNNKFLIRPTYQRSEVGNATKSSYLIESIILGLKIPPLFIYKRDDHISEVIDG